MEFKGTKGKWEVAKVKVFYFNVEVDNEVICEIISPNNDGKANALLISKAPEMLEMLEKVLTAKFTCEEIKQLIKEATEI
jgi:hypothetical protein